MSDPVSRPGRAVYDPAKREAAARLARDHPAWLVMWGPHSRRYFAYPTFNAPPGTVLTATSSGGLRARMRQAELASAARQPRVPQPANPPEIGPPDD